jgi:hypothetical protein
LARAWLVGALLVPLAGALLTPLAARAGFIDDYLIDPGDGMFDTSRMLTELPLGFLPVPAIITEPAVGKGLGLVGLFFHESDEQKAQRVKETAQAARPVLPTDISLVGGMATDNGSRALGAGHIGFWRHDSVRYLGLVGYPSLNLDFYSLGGTELPQPVGLNVKGPIVVQHLNVRLAGSPWFVGARQIYRRVQSKPTAAPDFSAIPDPALREKLSKRFADLTSGSTTTSGLGLGVQYDSRDNPFNPTRGYDYSAHVMRFASAIGSDVNYTAYDFTGLNYFALAPRWHLGLRAQYDRVASREGERLPTYVFPAIDLRGISRTRYQGYNVLVGEAELGWQMDPRWSLRGFAGVGMTADSAGDLLSSDKHTTYGAGFRYLIARRYGFVMGADLAHGPQGSVFYIKAGSTW